MDEGKGEKMAKEQSKREFSRPDQSAGYLSFSFWSKVRGQVDGIRFAIEPKCEFRRKITRLHRVILIPKRRYRGVIKNNSAKTQRF